MLGVGPESFTETGYQLFRVLVTALIALGMFGFSVAVSSSRYLETDVAGVDGQDVRSNDSIFRI